MAYTKKVWKDAPDTSTPINATNLNHMEDGIAEADVNAQNALDRLDDVDDEITQINSDLSKTPIDVTNLFSINSLGIWWSAIYNPIARTVKLSCYGHGSFPNTSLLFTIPSDYAFNVPDNYIVSALGSARSSDNAYAFTIAKFITSNNTYQVEVDYSSGIVAEEVSFCIEYQVTTN